MQMVECFVRHQKSLHCIIICYDDTFSAVCLCCIFLLFFWAIINKCLVKHIVSCDELVIDKIIIIIISTHKK